MRLLAIAMFLAAALGVTACGSGTADPRAAAAAAPHDQNATLVLDFTPNAIHAGIYTAIARGFDRSEGVHLQVVAPSASTDSIKLLETGRANFAILDVHDLAIARERHRDVVGIMAIVQRPLAAVIAAPGIRTPRQLEGKTVGVTGVPSDTAVLDSIVAGAGGDPAKVKTVTIGYNAVAALLAHRVAAATAFWNDEGLTLSQRDPGFHVFRVDQFGAPAYPELVLCATRASLDANPGLARGVVRALVRGYAVTLSDPKASETDLESLVRGLDPKLVATQLSAEEPAFRAPDGSFGELSSTALRAWARWEARFKIVQQPPNVTATFDPRFLAQAHG
jgi:ABC-type nitrate/sulfonate/bicarbonate transport system substrate-binding protein